MTERTFRRSPSPGRPPSSALSVQEPPVPKVPQDYSNIPPVPANAHRRSVSLDTTPTRVLSTGGRGQSVAHSGTPTGPESRTGSLQKVGGLDRTESRNSINFSRPLSPPPQSPVTAAAETSFLGAMQNGISAAEAEDIQYGVAYTADQPVKKKKKKVAPGLAEASFLHGGTLGSKPVVTPLEPGPVTEPVISGQTRPPPRKKKKKVAPTGQSDHGLSPNDTPVQTESESDSPSEKVRERRAQRASGVLAKQPSIVREDWEGEQGETSLVTEAPLATEAPFATEAQNRADQGLSPVGSPTPLSQGKMSVTAANVSRKIEEPASPTQPAGQALSPPATNGITTTPPARGEAAVTAALAVPPMIEEWPAHARPVSLSPSRLTRFSDRLSSDLAAGRKHEPLPRSVSPAKSALKHHFPPSPPSLSPVDGHFPRNRDSSVTPSESSDVSSSGISKHKKSARVSFEAPPEVVGTTAEVEAMDETAWAAGSHARDGRPNLSTIPSVDSIEELMTPRPQLPSFGSLRSKSRRGGADVPDSRTRLSSEGTVQSQRSPPIPHEANKIASLTTTSNDATLDTSVSSDHAIGAILAQEAQKKENQVAMTVPQPTDLRLPLPPVVTSVEGTGSLSDSESEPSVGDGGTSPAAEAGVTHAGSAMSSAPTPPRDQFTVPTLSVQPPTPGPEQGKLDDQWLVPVPGGFPSSTDRPSHVADSSTKAIPSHELSARSPADVGIAQPSPPARPSGQHVGAVAPGPALEGLNERDSDDESIYSDAAEDLSGLDGDGFGSIDAIVDSPVVDTTPVHRRTSPPPSPLANATQAGSTDTSMPRSWDEMQARWSGIAQHSRQSSIQQASSVPTAPVAVSQPRQKPKKNIPAPLAIATTPAASTGLLPSDLPPPSQNQSSAYPPIQTAKSGASRGPTSFRPSMRSEPAAGLPSGFRKSMRAENRPLQPQPPPAQLPGTQPTPPPPPQAALRKKQIPSAAGPGPSRVSTAGPKPAQPALSTDSDSESSYKRSRRARSGDQKHTMRRTMRLAAPTSELTGRDRPSSSATGQRLMKTTMRSSMDGGVPTLRGQPEAKRSSSLFSRSRRKSPSPASPQLALPSRFADSDDEDESRDHHHHHLFRSRFADSSDDEDDLGKFAPVRGIPRRAGDEESTDLEDSSDGEVSARGGPIPASNGLGPGGGSLSPASEKKRGLFGRLRGKKNKDEKAALKLGLNPAGEKSTILQRAAAAARDAAKEQQDHVALPMTKGREEKRKSSQFGFGSIEERDAVIEQTRLKLEKAQERRPTTPVADGKLHRRQTPSRILSDSWPLPAGMKARPNTSDGFGHNGSGVTPGLEEDIQTDDGIKDHHGAGVVYGRSGKKKRFIMLRKAFGLKD